MLDALLRPRILGDMTPPKRTHYDVMEVAPTASPAVLRAAYKTLIQVHHPDRHEGLDRSQAAAETVELNCAFAVLSDPVARARYDQALKQAMASPPVEPSDLSRSVNPSSGPFEKGGMSTPRAEPLAPTRRRWMDLSQGLALISAGGSGGAMGLHGWGTGVWFWAAISVLAMMSPWAMSGGWDSSTPSFPPLLGLRWCAMAFVAGVMIFRAVGIWAGL